MSGFNYFLVTQMANRSHQTSTGLTVYGGLHEVLKKRFCDSNLQTLTFYNS